MANSNSFPFVLTYRKDKNAFYIRFKIKNADGKISYLPMLSTHTDRKSDALEFAYKCIADGIPQKQTKKKESENTKQLEKPKENHSIKTLALINSVKTAELSQSESLAILDELKHKGIIRSYTLTGTKQDIKLCDYLLNFWNEEKSDYLKECRRQDRKLTVCHIQKSYNHIKKYWLPYFKDMQITELTKQDIRNFLNELDKLPLAPKTKAQIYGAGRKALIYAYNNDIIEKEITAGIMSFAGKSKERVILTKEQVRAVFSVEWIDERMKLANLLALITGMRLGEIRALQICDLGEDCIYVRHSWNEQEGLKCTKNRESRTVYCPSAVTHLLLEFAEKNPLGAKMDSFVFYGDFKPEQPACSDYFIRGLKDALLKIGMSKEQAKQITFHGWRHLYSTIMADRLPFRLLQTQTGHKTIAMVEHYSHHILDSDSEQIQNAQNYLFGEYLGIAHINADSKRYIKNKPIEYKK